QVGKLAGGGEQQAVVTVADALGQAGAVIEGTDRNARAEEVRDFDRDVEAGRGPVQAEPEVGASDHARSLFGVEPARPRVRAPRGKPCKSALERGAGSALPGDKDDERGNPPVRTRGFPSADAIFKTQHRVDDDVEVFVFGPAGRTDDETH